MDKLELYNLTLSVFNIEPITKEDMDKTPRHQDIATLDRWYMTALRKASREHRWSFLEVRLELGQDLGEEHGYLHSYALPKGLHSITWADGNRYAKISNRLLTDGEPIAYGYMDSILPDDSAIDIPQDFFDLVSLSLAYFTSYHFDPNLKSVIAQDYQSILIGMVSDELRHSRKDMEDY